MPRKNTNKVNSEGGPVFMGKVDNRGGHISGRSNSNNSKNIVKQAKPQKIDRLILIIVAIIGAIATIVAAIIKVAWPNL